MLFEERFIFKPQREHEASPADVGLEHQDIWLEAADGPRLHAWFFPRPREIAWLWFHGNGGNVSHRLDMILLLHDRLGVNVLIPDYRGYGRSEGAPSEQGVYRDAEASVQWVRAQPGLQGQALVLYGRSMGAAVAVEMASRHAPAGLVIESAFLSIRAMASESLTGRLMGPLLRSRFDSVGKLRNLETPLLVIHGDRDDTVPFEHGLRLFQAANDPKELLAVPGAGHADVAEHAGEAYVAALQRLLARLDRPAGD